MMMDRFRFLWFRKYCVLILGNFVVGKWTLWLSYKLLWLDWKCVVNLQFYCCFGNKTNFRLSWRCCSKRRIAGQYVNSTSGMEFPLFSHLLYSRTIPRILRVVQIPNTPYIPSHCSKNESYVNPKFTPGQENSKFVGDKKRSSYASTIYLSNLVRYRCLRWIPSFSIKNRHHKFYGRT